MILALTMMLLRIKRWLKRRKISVIGLTVKVEVLYNSCHSKLNRIVQCILEPHSTAT
jgi:hypothetical protein